MVQDMGVLPIRQYPACAGSVHDEEFVHVIVKVSYIPEKEKNYQR
jgi:hypothetical protein